MVDYHGSIPPLGAYLAWFSDLGLLPEKQTFGIGRAHLHYPANGIKAFFVRKH